MKKNQKGFTLVELLLVMAIIGILASAVLVGVSTQRERARENAALQTAKSALPYVVECYMKGNYSGTANTSVAGGDAFCSGGVAAPNLPSECSGTNDRYIIYGENSTYTSWAGTMRLNCPTAGYSIRCYYSGVNSGKCDII